MTKTTLPAWETSTPSPAGTGPAARRARARANPVMRRAMLDAKALLESAWGGDKRATVRLTEAITSSDLFRSAAGEVLDREMLAAYEAAPSQWAKFAKRTTVRSFQPRHLRSVTGAGSALPPVPEHSDYPATGYDVTETTVQVRKFGERFGYTFEANINDDLGELATVPAQWADKARRTEDDAALATLASLTTGAPNTEFFTSGRANLGTGTLTIARLQDALETLTARRDPAGRLLAAPQLQLVTGPALRFTAHQILHASEIRAQEQPGGTTVIHTTVAPNPFPGMVQYQCLDNLPGTAWFILPAPATPRPSHWVAFLAGHETPDLRYKADQGHTLTGGPEPADAGSFDDDTIYYRVRHIVGAAAGDHLFTYASDGQ